MTTSAVLLAALLAAAPPATKPLPPGEGADLCVGGPGDGNGLLSAVNALAFGPGDILHVLDGGQLRTVDKKPTWVGNSLVQRFDASGKFVGQFTVRDPALGDTHSPTRLAVDSAGRVYVTHPKAGVVQQYAPDGTRLKSIPAPAAFAVAVQKAGGGERVVVIGSPVDKTRKPADTTEATVIDPATGAVGPPLKLGRPVRNVHALTADAAGNLYAVADINQVIKFAPDGSLVTVLGGGTHTRIEDGSELLHTAAVDSTGHLYAMTWGNPGRVARFDPAFAAVTTRGGQFKWADPWSTHSGYVGFAVDSHDRLWVGVDGKHDPNGVNFGKYHPKPCVVRVAPNFLAADQGAVTTRDAALLGLKAAVRSPLPYHIAYDRKPVPVELVIAAGNRRVDRLTVKYHVWDMFKTEAASGTFELPLTDGEEARHPFTFTPPAFGWYTVACELFSGSKRLTAVAGHVGVTPKYPGMPVLADGESKGGWADAPREAFCGLEVMRLHPTEKNLDTFGESLDAAKAYGHTVVVQLSDAKECNAEFVRKVVTKYKGRVAYWEIWNEPNFRMTGDKYAALVAELTPVIKGIDPSAKVLGPTVCGIQLPWHEAFYKAGGGKHVDIVSVHDYEGHESIDPVHWRWKFAALRTLMAEHGDGDKPVWQTERAISGVRGHSFTGGAQAVRMLLHRDLLDSLGVPSHHNVHYYLNEGGYNTVPSYVWSKVGPHPAALALRTRHAMLKGRTFAGVVDLGPTGNKLAMALRYTGPDGDVIVLRNLGTADVPLRLRLTSGSGVEVVDAFGNAGTSLLTHGFVPVSATPMPKYIKLAKGQGPTFDPLDFGKNVASEATFAYSAPFTGEPAWLNNGIIEVFHAGHPHGGTSKAPLFVGEMPDGTPPTLDITFPKPRPIGKLVVFGLRADNAFCALLDYDVEYHDGAGWKKLAEARTPVPPSDPVETPGCDLLTWYQDTNCHAHTFAPVTTDKLRLVVRRATHGFVPDANRSWGKVIPSKLMLREVEVYE